MGSRARVWEQLVRPRGDRRWDVFLRATAVAGLLGIPVVVWVPGSVTLVWLAIVSLPTNSPLSPILPTFFEPLIMEAAKWSPSWAVTLVGTAGYMYMEYINWHVYAWVLNWNRMAAFRSRPSVRWGVAVFRRSPFWMVVIFAFTPLPFWVGRALAILDRYPLRRFLVATVLGRLPRWFFYAWFGGQVSVPLWLEVAMMVVPAAIIIGGRLLRGEALLAEVAPPIAEETSPIATTETRSPVCN